ncbi:hypothetical protein [Candidatus Marithrix sp. Canyon 246]|uniref:hypothetical protein n=1 Tax=Candidatus Marithrix sp. Canyon 246 TaxID=1827136 RepID=UPI000849F8C1|nr:hypothetical protein [Candidatus Marithrix sp. Canyon 246]
MKIFIIISLLLVAPVSVAEVDAETGLIIADGYKVVKKTCTRCHSASNIIQYSGTRLTWLGLIRWMQNTQDLEEFEADKEKQILDYLETNYGPKEAAYRRAHIPSFLMPPNPYRSLATIKFVGLKDHYKLDETLTVDLVIADFPAYSKGRFDLWAAIHLPNKPDDEFVFLKGTASEPLFNSLKPQSFQVSLETVNSTYSVLKNFTIPSVEIGKYVFYAILVEKSANPLTGTDITRSNLAVQTITVGD